MKGENGPDDWRDFPLFGEVKLEDIEMSHCSIKTFFAQKGFKCSQRNSNRPEYQVKSFFVTGKES